MNDKLVRNLEFKEWREFLISVNEDLNEINKVMRQCYLSKEMILDYCNLLNILVVSKSAYIRDKNIIKKLQIIERFIYGTNFLPDVKKGSIKANNIFSGKFIELKNIYSQIVRDFADCGLIPRVTETEIIEPDKKYLGVAV